jgi:hypothetical protein
VHHFIILFAYRIEMAAPHRLRVRADITGLRITSLAVSTLDTHALFALGDLRGKLAKLFQGRFI